MKKLLIQVMIIVILFTIVGCSNNEASNDNLMTKDIELNESKLETDETELVAEEESPTKKVDPTQPMHDVKDTIEFDCSFIIPIFLTPSP